MLQWLGIFRFYSLGKEIKYDKFENPIKLEYLGQIKNLLVETGKDFIIDIMTNSVSDYISGTETIFDIFPKYLAVGSSNKAADFDDWKLGNEITRVPIETTDMERISDTSIARYTAILTDPSSYDIYEAGLFLSSTEPTTDPQIEPAQRVNAMISRGVEATPINKIGDKSIQITYDIYF